MTDGPWNKHTPGDPMPCKCGDSVVAVKLRNGVFTTGLAKNWGWRKVKDYPYAEINEWSFAERKGEDVIAADPYNDLEWDEDDTAIVALKKPGQPWWVWVWDGDMVRFRRQEKFEPARNWSLSWVGNFVFQIKRRPVLTPAVPQVLDLLSVATDDEAEVIRSAARRANIEVPE